jgi:hypothetical protein
MDMKKLFHVLVVGGAVIGTGAGCSKPKASEGTAAPPAQATPSTPAPAAAAPAATPTPGSDAPGTPAAPPAQPEEKGGGAGAW